MKSLTTGDNFMTELQLKHLECPYSARETFTKHRERIQKLKEKSDFNYVYKTH